ncbi:MAG: hypothetical protein RL417_1419 [Pseudomonadota bacterium]|jgi:hypothetical protein
MRIRCRCADGTTGPISNRTLIANFSFHTIIHFISSSLRERFLSLGGICLGLEGAQDWDFIFRLVETIPAEAIRHVPEVLYHWRSTPDSTARSHRAKRYTAAAQIRAVTEHLQRVDIPVANVQVRDDLPCVQITYPEVPETDAHSVIVVTPAPISLGPTSHGEILEVTPRGVGDPSLPREITPVLIHELRSYLLRSEVGLVGGLTTDQRGIIAGGGG